MHHTKISIFKKNFIIFNLLLKYSIVLKLYIIEFLFYFIIIQKIYIYISLFIRSQYNQYNKRIELNKIYSFRNNFIYFELFWLYENCIYTFFRI